MQIDAKNANRCKKIYKKASLTIELSLIMPGILAIFIIIIFTAYYLHDRCIFEQAMYSSLKAYFYEINNINNKDNTNNIDNTNDANNANHTDVEDTSENPDAYLLGFLTEEFRKYTENRLIGKWDLSIKSFSDDEKIGMSIEGKMMCINGIFPEYLSDLIFSINSEESVYMIYGPSYIRGSCENTN